MSAIKTGTILLITKASASKRTTVGQLVKVVALFEIGGKDYYRIAASRAEVGGNPQWMRGGPLVSDADAEVAL